MLRLPDDTGLIEVFREVFADSGTPLAFRDEGLFQSALARPSNLIAYKEDVDAFDAAASLAAGISANHPFVDGNKRAAAAAFMVALDLNGWRLTASQKDVVGTFLALAAGEMSEADLAAWGRANAVEASDTPG